MSEGKKTVLHDEQGNWSAARTILIAQLIYVDVCAAVAALSDALILTPEWWTYNGTLTVGLIAWTAGPRGLQYLGPKIAAAGKAIGAVAGRFARTDDRYRDDES